MALGSTWIALGHLLGASWRVLGSWRPVGGVLEDLWSDFGGQGSHLGGVLDGFEAVLETLLGFLGSESEPQGHLMGVQECPTSTSLDELSSKWRNHTTRTPYEGFECFVRSRGLCLETTLVLELLGARLSHPGALGGFPRAVGGIWSALGGSWSALGALIRARVIHGIARGDSGSGPGPYIRDS